VQALEEVIADTAITGAPLHVVHIASTGGLNKMTLMPAQRLEKRVPAMRKKGRIQVGADADIVVFNSGLVNDRSPYQEPARYSEGIRFVFVNGVPVVKDGQLQMSVHPGRPVRAPYQK
jgi:dihydroorotase